MLAFSERLEYYLESPCLCLYLEVFFRSALNFRIYIKVFDPFGVVFVQWEIRELVSFFYM